MRRALAKPTGHVAGKLLAALLVLVALGAGLLCATHAAPPEEAIASYTTSFAGRTPSQIENSLRAAKALDGVVVPPRAAFSFNSRVGPWTADRGYRRAPVSYDGELTVASGGGVCQVSTTLYGAALLGGMEILERHRHFWPVGYARPGTDAAVAFPSTDLRFRNPLPAPVRVRARQSGQRLIVELLSTTSAGRYSLETEQIAVRPPATLLRRDARLSPGQMVETTHGQAGQRVAVYRLHQVSGGPAERTLISVDTYPALNRIVKTGAAEP